MLNDNELEDFEDIEELEDISDDISNDIINES